MIAGYVNGFVSKGKPCNVKNETIQTLIGLTEYKREMAISRLMQAGVLESSIEAGRRYLTINQPKPRTALEIYIEEQKRRKQEQSHPENQNIPENRHSPENQDTSHPENQDSGHPENQGHIININKNDYNIISQGITSMSINNNEQTIEPDAQQNQGDADFWKEWELFLNYAYNNKLPVAYMMYIRNNSEKEPRIRVLNIHRAMARKYDHAAILESSYNVRFENAPEHALLKALEAHPQVSERFRREADSIAEQVRNEGINDFCRERGIDKVTFERALEQRYNKH